MTGEELLFRFGFDSNGLNNGLRQAGEKVRDFSEHTSEHMTKAATSARAVHGVIGEISKISPEAGVAITAAFSGPMAALELLKMGIEVLKDRWEDVKKEALEAKEAFEKALEEPGEKARALRKAIFEREREGPIGPAERRRLEAINDAEFEAKNTEKLEKAKKKANEAPSLFRMVWDFASKGAIRAVGDVADKQAELLAGVAEENKALDARKTKLIDLEESQTKALDMKKKEEELDRLDEQRLRNRAELVRKMHEEEERNRKAEEAFQAKLTTAARSYLPEQSAALKAPGQYGDLARAIQAARGQISQGILGGNMAAVEAGTQALFGKDEFLNPAELKGENVANHMNDRLEAWNKRNQNMQEQFIHRGLTRVHRPGLEDKMQNLQQAALEIIKAGLTDGIVVKGKDNG